MRVEGASVGYAVLLELARGEGTPAHVRRAAAKDLLEFGGHSAAGAAAAAADLKARKGLEEMTADELERLAVASAATLQQLRRQAGTIDITPDPPRVTPKVDDPTSLL